MRLAALKPRRASRSAPARCAARRCHLPPLPVSLFTRALPSATTCPLPAACHSLPAFTPRRLCVHAKLRRRLLSYILSAPQRSERYFESSGWRRWMWAGISLGTGFYAGKGLWTVRT